MLRPCHARQPLAPPQPAEDQVSACRPSAFPGTPAKSRYLIRSALMRVDGIGGVSISIVADQYAYKPVSLQYPRDQASPGSRGAEHR